MSKGIKLLIMVLLVIAAFCSWWFWQPEEQVEEDELLAWIQNGYARQFCAVIYPKISGCVKLEAAQCETFANQQILPCITNLQMNLPEFGTSEQRKAIYDSVAPCFQQNTHDELVKEYLIDSDECRELMS